MILDNKITFTFYILDPINDLDFKESIKTMSGLIYESFSNHNKYFINITPCIIYTKYTFTTANINKWVTVEIPLEYTAKNPYELFSIITKASYDVFQAANTITKRPVADKDNAVVLTVNEGVNIILMDKELFLRDSIDLNYIANAKFDKEVEGV